MPAYEQRESHDDDEKMKRQDYAVWRQFDEKASYDRLPRMMMMLLTANQFDHRDRKGSDTTCMRMCSWRTGKTVSILHPPVTTCPVYWHMYSCLAQCTLLELEAAMQMACQKSHGDMRLD